MDAREVLRIAARMWRIPVVALLAAILAFGGSYAFSPTYAASTSLLIRGRDATVLTTTGASLDQQPGVVDASLAKALGETQSALASSRTSAEMVVNELHLDQPKPKPSGFISSTKRQAGDAFRKTKAYLTHGFYAKPDPHNGAVESVMTGVSAKPRKDSYAIDLIATADNPQLAADMANSASNALVTVSHDRFQKESTAFRDFLAQQVGVAEQDERTALSAVREFRQKHNISDAQYQSNLDATASQNARQSLLDARVDLKATQAELEATRRSLSAVPQQQAVTNRITTGRSTTEIQQNGSNQVFVTLEGNRQRLEAELAGKQAKVSALNGTGGRAAAANLSADEIALRDLDLKASIASDTVIKLRDRHQQAVLDSASGRVDLTRIDQAGVPTYPVAPKRYLYMGMGMVLGALLGLVLSYFAARRRGETLLPTFGVPANAPFANAPFANAPFADGQPATQQYFDVRNGDPPTIPVPVAAGARESAGRFEVFGNGQRNEG